MLTRRVAFAGLGLVGSLAKAVGDSRPLPNEWRFFKSRFMSGDGRIIDNGNGGVSHSEGQGWGLLFAVAAQDQASFDLILSWTTQVLRRPHDSLHSWRYIPHEHPSVPDLNNATDGDMFIAAALIEAGRLWRRPAYLLAAAAIGRDILRLLVRRVGRFTVLLPGVQGFETADAIIVNPSYYAFPMLDALAKVVPSSQWDRLWNDGRALIDQGLFGRWTLPPDWLQIAKLTSTPSPAPGWPKLFSFDAIRVPLWWLWQGWPAGPAMQSIRQLWCQPSSNVVPAWINLETNDVASYPATPGMTAIIRLMRLASGSRDEKRAPSVEDAASYYDASLMLLSRIAEHEMIAHRNGIFS